MDNYERAVAVVGMAAILPDAPNATTFWQNIIGKRYSISEVPPGRWGFGDYYDPDPKTPDRTYSKIGGWVRGFQFDWKRFKIPPKVAAAMDEGQQWALTAAADCLDDYGFGRRPLDTERTAVIIGTAMGGELHYHTTMRIMFPEYLHALAAAPGFQALPAAARNQIVEQFHQFIDAHIPTITEDSMPGELPNIVSGRVANVLNLRGPNFITDAACASSFAAVEAALELLTEHKVDAAIAGGVDRNMGIGSFVKFCKIGALSATGTRPFGDGADGFVMGEGAAVFLLKRLADAEAAGDRIYAVIRGVGGASDGKGKGITAPNPVGQQLAIRRAWENAGLEPASASLVEAHGTSTRVGDVAEVESLTAVFGQAPRHSIGLGSVKSNIGHLKAGAGAAGLLKAVLALHHKTLPPTLNAVKPNPNIDFANSPFYLIHDPQPWSAADGRPRRAGVSAYGFGGTNFHVALEEYVPGLLRKEHEAAVAVARTANRPTADGASRREAQPIRGILAVGAQTSVELKAKLDELVTRVEGGWVPPFTLPGPAERNAPERLFIDYGDHAELLDRIHKAQKAAGFDTAAAWKAMQAQGIFRGSGRPAGKLAFLFPGQGSQYVNMGRELAAVSPTVRAVIEQGDAVMTPILGKPLSSYIFVDPDDRSAVSQANWDLMQTAITQPAMLTLDTAIYELLADYGFKPDMVMGHSLGEYAGLIAAGILPFAQALEASAARGREMSDLDVPDVGKMAAVLAPIPVIEETLAQVNGYVVPANINSPTQCVIGGASTAVEQAMALFEQKGYKGMLLPVSHAFHTAIVAPASVPLRRVLDRMDVTPPQLPLVANVTGAFYPTDVTAIKDLLQKQIASPVQWVKGLETLYAAGARTFVEVGPKRALRGFANELFKDRPEVQALLTNHPKTGELASFNQALCGLYAAGYAADQPQPAASAPAPAPVAVQEPAMPTPPTNGANTGASDSLAAVAQLLAQALQHSPPAAPQASHATYDRNAPPTGSIVISGTGLGLPGSEKPVMDPENAQRILRGEQFVDLIPERFRKRMVGKRITRIVKSESGGGSFQVIDDSDMVIKLAGRAGKFDLHEEYGVPNELIEALDMTSQLAMAAGLDALREAGIPLVMAYKKTTTGKFLPDRWMLPESLRDETGVIFASAFPGGDRFADEFEKFYVYRNRVEQIELLEDLRRYTADPATLAEIGRRLSQLREELEREPYTFDRRFLFRILSMGHSQFAQYIGARGPNTHVNAACASTAQGVALAEDWIRSGRCRRVIVLGGDDVTGNHLLEWVGAGFLAVGAVTTQDRVDEAALPFDRRRHGTILGMGACALVVESEDAVRERGMRAIVELLSSETSNSAFHGTRLDVEHIALVMENLVTAAERRFGVNRYAMAPQTVFMSHETFTPARGGSAAAEITALRKTFGDAANEIIIANTKGFTGHAMGVGVEDVIAVKILEYGIVPPVPNFKELDPELGALNLSRGGRYPVQYAIHLAAGFGSQIAMTLTRRIPGGLDRIDNKARYQRWLDEISGNDHAATEVVQRILRVQAVGAPQRAPVGSSWRYGTGPVVRADGAPAVGISAAALPTPAPRPIAPPPVTTPAPTTPTPAPQPEPARPQPTQVVKPEPAVVTPAVVAPSPAPAVVAPPAPAPAPTPEPAPAPAAPQRSPIEEQVLAIVAQQTGYPSDMLDLDLDMEADLGIDTVKQAETFLAIREAFAIPRQDTLQLRDYPTLGAVIGFVRTMRPDLADAAPPAAPAPVAPAVAPAPAPATPVATTAATAADAIADKVLAIVAAQTGYPSDMLEMDLDMEADLGIDTVKQAETFLAIREAFAIPRQDNLQLRDYPTLGAVIGFVRTMRPDLATPAPAPAPVAPAVAPAPTPATPVATTAATAADAIADKVLAIVAAQTGYPSDMLEMDLDMEADLGIDTVKQAETFLAIREAFAIPRQDTLQLRDYPTLGAVIGFVRKMRPDLAAPAPAPAPISPAPAPAAVTSVAVPAAAPAAPATTADSIADKVLAIVAEQTGYPTEMLEIDLDMEADLGIDTVKQAETFLAIREAFAIPRQDTLQLRDYPTLGAVIGFVRAMRPDLAASSPAPSAPTAVSTPSTSAPTAVTTADSITDKVLAIVAEQTGYPTEMLEMDLDMEADLGIDTVKQAETFLAIREAFAIPRQDTLQLRDYPTLGAVIGFVRTMRPDLAAAAPTAAAAPVAPPPAAVAPTARSSRYQLADADRFPRRVPTPALRPAEEWYKHTGVMIGKQSRIVVMPDEGGVGKALIKELEKAEATVLELSPAQSAAEIEETIGRWSADGPIQGVYWLPALDVEPALHEMDLDAWRAHNNRRVKLLYTTMRALYGRVSGPGNFLVSATRLGGLHGYGPAGSTAPLGGAVTGFTKAYKRERGEVLVKAVDFEISRKTAAIAKKLIIETLFDPGVIEIGYVDEQRFAVTLTEQPAADGRSGLTLDANTVFLVTGAAGGITSAIVADLAAASGGVFYLLDLTSVPDRHDPQIALFRSDKEQLKQTLLAAAKAAGAKLTPVQLERQVMAIERSEAALRAIEAVEAAGGVAHYRSVNLLDGPALTAVVEDIRAQFGRIDALIHAGGIEISKGLADKPAEQFNLVFDIKADGFFSLLRAAGDMPIGAVVSFSSVAGRFGNSGQTDYSAANDLLCKLSSHFRNSRPSTRGIAIDWTAWGDIGMATRGSIPTIMKAAGIDMLPPEVGVPTVRRELTAGGFSGEIVVGGALGVMIQEWDATGGLNLDEVNKWLRKKAGHLALVRQITGARLYEGWTLETTLDPQAQPFLFDHAPDAGTPWLPGVMATEALAEAAAVLAGPDYRVAAVESMRMSGAFKFFRMEPRTLYLTVQLTPTAAGELLASATLCSHMQPKREGLPLQVKQHFAATVRLTTAPAEPVTRPFTPPTAEALPITQDAIYPPFFHGPAYQVIERAGIHGDVALAALPLTLPPNIEPADAAELMAPRLIESCFQAAALWSIHRKGAMAFPLGYASAAARPLPTDGRRLFALVSTSDDGQTFDGDVVDADGNVYVQLRGYLTVGRPE